MNIYVGNLAYSVTDTELKAAFADHGEVISAEVIINKHTGRSRGYGFVRMATDEQGRNAIRALNGSDLQGRAMRVDESKPETEQRSPDDRSRRSNPKRKSPTAGRERHHAAPASPPAKRSGGLFGFVKNLFSRG